MIIMTGEMFTNERLETRRPLAQYSSWKSLSRSPGEKAEKTGAMKELGPFL